MSFSNKVILAVAATAVCLSLPSIAQAQGRGHGGGNAATDGRTIDGRVFGSNRDRGSANGPDTRPRGWDQGKKKGWNGGALPPGLSRQRSGARTGTSSRVRPNLEGTSNTRVTDGRTLPQSRASAGGRTKK
jgi:hypothetical protein